MKKVFLPFAAGLAILALPALAEPVQITVDTSAPLCTNFLGFGVQWSPYPWFDISDAAWRKMDERLDFMRVPIVRLMTRSYTYCDGFDAAGKPIYNWDNNRMKKMYRLLDYCQAHGVKVILGEWDHPSSQQDRPGHRNGQTPAIPHGSKRSALASHHCRRGGVSAQQQTLHLHRLFQFVERAEQQFVGAHPV